MHNALGDIKNMKRKEKTNVKVVRRFPITFENEIFNFFGHGVLRLTTSGGRLKPYAMHIVFMFSRHTGIINFFPQPFGVFYEFSKKKKIKSLIWNITTRYKHTSIMSMENCTQ